MSTGKFLTTCIVSGQAHQFLTSAIRITLELEKEKKETERNRPVPPPHPRLIWIGISRGDAWASRFFKSSSGDSNTRVRLKLHSLWILTWGYIATAKRRKKKKIISGLRLKSHFSKWKAKMFLKNMQAAWVFSSCCKSGQSHSLLHPGLIAWSYSLPSSLK